MATSKKITGVRLTDAGKKMLEALAVSRGVSQTAVMEQLIRKEAKREKIEVPAPERTEGG